MSMSIDAEDTKDGRRLTGQHAARVGGRSERVVRDVLAATMAELARVGYAALRVEDVAAGAGVNKTTVYRRWPVKSDLVAAALRSASASALAAPDTGSLRSDLLELLRRHVALFATAQGRLIGRMMMVELDHPDVAALVRTLREEKLAPWLDAIERAKARGEIPRGSEATLMVDMILGTTFAKIRRDDPVDDAFLRAVVDLVVLGAEHGGAVPR